MSEFQANQDPEQHTSETFQHRRGVNRRAVMLSVALFVLIIAGMFVFAFLQQDMDETDDASQNDDALDESPYSQIDRIEGTHFYIDGVHTIVGEIAMPTPCDLLESSAVVAESMPEQITLEFSVVNNAEFCAQQITPQRFKVSATASADASFRAVFNGREVPLNLIEAGEGETPEDFEVFIKG